MGPMPASVSLPPLGVIDRRFPLVLLPVRIEMRYFDIDILTVELRVRIFPSQVHVTTNRTTVDAMERDEVVAYWQVRKQKGDNAPETLAAWEKVKAQFGEPRALYLRKILTPAVGPNGKLVFPDVPITLENAPANAGDATEATGLPSRFVVVGYQGDKRNFAVVGSPIPARIDVGMFADDAATVWQRDFKAAEQIGLAVRVRVMRFQIPPVTKLLVYGVREDADAASSQAALEQLIERHSRDSGAALLPAGTPTNHTPGAPVRPLPAVPGTTPGNRSDGARLAAALGVRNELFGSVGGADLTTNPLAEAMQTALWPATIGYFLTEVMSPLFDGPAVARAKSLFRQHVRPAGPWPVLAFGSQPYGVLPVSSMQKWRKPDGTEDRLSRGLHALRVTWFPALDKIPKLANAADTASALVDILSQSPVSTRWTARTLETHQVARRLFPGIDDSVWQSTVEALRRAVMAAGLAPVGLSGEPRILDFVFDQSAFHLNVPLVAGGSADPAAPLPANYISAIASAKLEDLKNGAIDGATPRTLLYLLLRHATLLAMANTADRFQVRPLNEAVFIERAATTETAWTRLQKPVAQLGAKPLAEILAGPLPNTPLLADYAEHRQALNTLAAAPVADLERASRDAIDGCSYRLDAWITAMASERLATMRTSAPQNLNLGAYAFLDAPPVPAILPKDGAPPQPDPDSEGYIHAPRLNLARTAAVLRAAFLARQNQASQAPLLVDLSSERVRGAHWLLNGVRNGASLAALLGARVERWLIGRRLGPQIAPLRDQFSVIDGSGRKRIDGLALAEEWGARPPAAPLFSVAKQLAELMDAAADLLLAEAVHQHASGNPNRAQTALTALETGTALPEEFDVIRSEGDSRSRVWRLILPVKPDALDKWFGRVLGDFSKFRAHIHRGSAAPIVRSLKDAQVTATQLVDLAKDDPEGPALVERLRTDAQEKITFEPALANALLAANAIARLSRVKRPLEPGDLGKPGQPPAALPEMQKNSRKKEWLHDLARLRPAIDALDAIDTFARGQGRDSDLHFYDAGDEVTLVSIGTLKSAKPLDGYLIDGWTEKTPGTEATTGVAFHYDAPRSRAPQAILISVPPNPTLDWTADAIEATLLETAWNAQVRMVRPSEVFGSFLPALYFAENLEGDTISTNFFDIGTTVLVKEQ